MGGRMTIDEKMRKFGVNSTLSPTTIVTFPHLAHDFQFD